ncbi:hypothetical protein HK405_004640 [Cladochytrium tenue]|nr:hypothetical protein HK405_004640 [Cladochytrium tenue]
MPYDQFKSIRILGQAAPQRLFSVLRDAERWPVWDVDLSKVVLADRAKTSADPEGAQGKLTMKAGSTFDFTIRNVQRDQYLSYLTRLPGADADWYWDFKQQDEQGLDLKMGVRITGPATFVWRLVLGPFLPAAFEKCTANLKTLVEEGKVDGEAVEVGV